MRHVTRLVVLLGVLALLRPGTAAAQSAGDAHQLFRDRLAALSPGAWVASNAAYSQMDGGIERFGLDWDLVPGGNAARGCLWGETGDTSRAFWEFFFYWDPVLELAVIYQTSPAGAIAVGTVDPTRPESEMVSQTLVQPNGDRFEIGHTTHPEGEHVRIDRSFRRAIGASEWVTGRTYRWERREDVEAPCWRA